MDDEKKGFAEWCLVEVMGHIRLAGFVTEQDIAGCGFLRVDIPDYLDGGKVVAKQTQYIGPKSIHTLKPVSEDVARQLALSFRVQPVHAWDIPSPKHTQPALPIGDSSDFDDDDSGICF